MIRKVVLEDEYFGEEMKGAVSKLLLSPSPSDPKTMVEIGLKGDSTVTLKYRELEEALQYLKGESVIR